MTLAGWWGPSYHLSSHVIIVITLPSIGLPISWRQILYVEPVEVSIHEVQIHSFCMISRVSFMSVMGAVWYFLMHQILLTAYEYFFCAFSSRTLRIFWVSRNIRLPKGDKSLVFSYPVLKRCAVVYLEFDSGGGGGGPASPTCSKEPISFIL